MLSISEGFQTAPIVKEYILWIKKKLDMVVMLLTHSLLRTFPEVISFLYLSMVVVKRNAARVRLVYDHE